MRRFVAAAAAVSIAAIACASGTAGYDPIPDGGAAIEGGVPVGEAGPSGEAGSVTTPDGAAHDGAGADASAIDAGSRDDGGSTADTGARGDGASSDAGAGIDSSVSPTVPGSCDPTQWVVTASASASNNPPAFAVDGLPPTRWSTGAGQAVGQYFQIDFGGFVFLDQIVLDDSYGTSEAEDYGRGIAVLGSADGTNFSTTLTTADFSTDPGAIATISFAQSSTRAVRLQLTTGVPTVWWAIHELRLDCHPVEADGGAGPAPDGGDAAAASCAGDAAWTSGAGISHTGWTATASSVGPNDTIQGAIDGTSSTRWSSGQAQAGGEWLKVDLGQATTLSAVSAYLLNSNVTDYPSAYALQLSNDDLTYTTVATGLGAVTTPICVSRQSARYVKLTQTGTGDSSWWSVYELDVFP